MKKIFLIITLLLSVNIYSNNIELTTLEKQNLLEWTNKYCGENHKNYKSLSKDRYFICKQSKQSNIKNHPKGLQGTLTFYEEGIDKHTIKNMVFLGILFFLATLLLGAIILTKRTNRFGTMLREWSIIRLSSVLIFGSLVLGGVYIYDFLKDFSTNTLKNGNIEAITTALPIYNMLNLEEPPLILAVSSGSIEAVKYLIEEKKYNPNEPSKDWHGNTTNPFDLALSQRSYEIADYLKQYIPADEPINILIASKAFDLDLLKKSIELTELSIENILDAFIVSIRAFDYDAMRYLHNLEPSIINIQADRFTSKLESSSLPIEVAVSSNNLEAFKFLLSKDAKLVSETAFGPRERIDRIEYNEIISKVVYSDNIKFFNLLLESGYEIKKLDAAWMLKNIFLPAVRNIKRGESKKIEKIIIDKGWITKKEMQRIKDDVYHGQI